MYDYYQTIMTTQDGFKITSVQPSLNLTKSEYIKLRLLSRFIQFGNALIFVLGFERQSKLHHPGLTSPQRLKWRTKT